jgi:hypothetical protein
MTPRQTGPAALPARTANPQDADKPATSVWAMTVLPYVLAALAAYVLIYFVIDFSSLSGGMSRGSALLDNALDSLRGGGLDLDKSFRMTARIISLIPAPLREPVIFAWGSLLIFCFVGSARNSRLAFFAVLLIIPAEIFALRVAFKETISSAVFLLSGWSLMKRDSLQNQLMASCFLAAYALFAREYYFLTFSIGVFLILATRTSPRTQVMIYFSVALLIVCIGLITPPEIFHALQGSRDRNILRIGGAASRTAFLNPLEPSNFGAFIANYIYAFARLHIPIIFFQTPKEVFQMTIVGLYGAFLVKSLRSRSSNTRTAGLLLLSHVLVLWLFEPDAGSYLRHMTGAFGLFLPIISGASRSRTVSAPHTSMLQSARPAPLGSAA